MTASSPRSPTGEPDPREPHAQRSGWRRLGERLDVRIVAIFLGLLLLVQLAAWLATRSTIERNARAQLAHELVTGENVLQRLIAQNVDNLRDAARLLAQDYGFREAVASGDAATLADALANQAARIGATAALFSDAQFRTIASTASDPAPIERLSRAAADGATVQVLDGQPFLLVSVDVRAPQPIGHVALGFPLQHQLVQDLEQISGLRMALLSRPLAAAAGEGWRVLPVGTRAAAMAPLGATLRSDSAAQSLQLDGEAYEARVLRLGRDAKDEVAAVLLRSIDEAVAPYRELQLAMLAITLVGVAVFGAGSVVTARRITRPIQALRVRAEQLGAGDYSTPVPITSRDEVRELAQSFETMRQTLQQRDHEIRRLAYWDALTGLPNRAQLVERLQHRLRESGPAPCAVLMLDLHRFKHVNGVLGQAFGDRLLRQLGERLAAQVGRGDELLARVGGDEFAVVLPGADVDIACEVAHRLHLSLEKPLQLEDHTVDASACLGIAVAPQHGEDAAALLQRAEVAMYAAKARQATLRVYDPSLDSASQESLSLLGELRTAIEHDQFRLFLQPKIALATGRVVGAEALVRWVHPQRGMVAPMRFIPFAEQTGFIRELTGWMLERCAARSRQLRGEGLALKFAVNLSTRDLLDQDLPSKFERVLQREGVAPQALCLEITESAIMDDPERALQTLQRLHAMGLRLSIDDFGTGYSSLAYLKRLPVHELKIDRSFVMAMERDRADYKIVRSTVDLAHNLGLSVVAEGVENGATWNLLRGLGCDEAQGYYMARPMPEEEFGPWARRWSAPPIELDTAFSQLA